MQLPEVFGSINQQTFFVYVACDQTYFDRFAKSLVNSVLTNTTVGIHIHVFNPTDDTLLLYKNVSRVSMSYEYFNATIFQNAANFWDVKHNQENNAAKYEKITKCMSKRGDTELLSNIVKTYYTCARFIRLEQLTTINDSFFAIDIDAIVRKNIVIPEDSKTIYVHKSYDKYRVPAGALLIKGSNTSRKFLKKYSDTMTELFKLDYIYWSMDQEILTKLVDKYDVGILDRTFVDWDMSSDSIVWTAKGIRKNWQKFTEEQQLYSG